ncbi:hypothetical protein ACGFNP_38850 [Nonomuraea sp. NPDC049269]
MELGVALEVEPVRVGEDGRVARIVAVTEEDQLLGVPQQGQGP